MRIRNFPPVAVAVLTVSLTCGSMAISTLTSAGTAYAQNADDGTIETLPVTAAPALETVPPATPAPTAPPTTGWNAPTETVAPASPTTAAPPQSTNQATWDDPAAPSSSAPSTSVAADVAPADSTAPSAVPVTSATTAAPPTTLPPCEVNPVAEPDLGALGPAMPPAGSTTTSTTTTTVAPNCIPVPVDTTVAPTTTAVPAPAALGVNNPVPGEYAAILRTIRLLESGDNYTLAKNKGGASGAYQYIDSTWGNYAGYPSAYLAPPWVQDERAVAHVKGILNAYGGDVSMIPVIWYYPMAAGNPALMDQVPLPQYGNTLTPREYQARWLRLFERVSGQHIEPSQNEMLAGLPPVLAANTDALNEISFPVLGRASLAGSDDCTGDRCEPGSDATIYGQQLQPVLAVVDGVVTSVNAGDALTGQASLTITDEEGRTYRYTGFNDDSPKTADNAGHPSLQFSANAQVGATVRAGMILGFMGVPGAPSTPEPAVADEPVGSPVPAEPAVEEVFVGPPAPTVAAEAPTALVSDASAGGDLSTGDGSTDQAGLQPSAVAGPAVPAQITLTIRDEAGVRLDALAFVTDAQARQACRVSTGPWALAPDDRIGTDDAYTPFEDVVVDANQYGGFMIHGDGTVTAHGQSSMIVGPGQCEVPTETYGAGAAGAPAPDGFTDPITLPVQLWIAGLEPPGVETPRFRA